MKQSFIDANLAEIPDGVDYSKSLVDLFDLNAINTKSGNNILHYALSKDGIDITELLKEKRDVASAMINMGNIKGSTPLHFACNKGDTGLVKIFLDDYGAEVNRQNESGGAPLHFACKGGHKEVADLLIEKGANINVKNRDDETPLHLACREGHQELVVLLLNNGADPSLQNKSKETPLDLLDLLEEGPKEKIKEAVKEQLANRQLEAEKAKEVLRQKEIERAHEIELLQEQEAARAKLLETKPSPSLSASPPSFASSALVLEPDRKKRAPIKDKLTEELQQWQDYTSHKKETLQAPQNIRQDIVSLLENRNRTEYHDIESITPTTKHKAAKYIGFSGSEKLSPEVFQVEGVDINVAFDSKGKMYLSENSLKMIQENEITCCITIEGQRGNKNEYLEFRQGNLFIIDHGPDSKGTSLVGGKDKLIELTQGRQLDSPQQNRANDEELDRSSSKSSQRSIQGEDLSSSQRQRAASDPERVLENSPTREKRATSDPELYRGEVVSSAPKPKFLERDFSQPELTLLSRLEELDQYGAALDKRSIRLHEDLFELNKQQQALAKEQSEYSAKQGKIKGTLQMIPGTELKEEKDGKLSYTSGHTVAGQLTKWFKRPNFKEAKQAIDDYNAGIIPLNQKQEELDKELQRATASIKTLQEEKANQALDRSIATLLDFHYGQKTAGDLSGNDLTRTYLENRAGIKKQLAPGHEQLKPEKILDEVVGLIRKRIDSKTKYTEKPLDTKKQEQLRLSVNDAIKGLKDRKPPLIEEGQGTGSPGVLPSAVAKYEKTRKANRK